MEGDFILILTKQIIFNILQKMSIQSTSKIEIMHYGFEFTVIFQVRYSHYKHGITTAYLSVRPNNHAYFHAIE